MTATSAAGGASNAAASFSAGTALTISTAWWGSSCRNSEASGSRIAVALTSGATTSKKPLRLTPRRSSRKMFLAVSGGTSSSSPLTAWTSACRSSVPVLHGCRSRVQLRSLGYLQVSARREQGPNVCGCLPSSTSGRPEPGS
eukprot:CAMPEP_0175468438 /NCGR_PEP_ID=MMETSP0095-20121207/71829_1 /TAXON_ID=311494 /ORGANISM="Alexandrium monilatum, Strain CCMP3105" /LENGTH=141 /DNA_ID=CAMNT_0016769829 /DNA_START=91 /DNA_END=513 /DNA_ORIENTATION=-